MTYNMFNGIREYFPLHQSLKEDTFKKKLYLISQKLLSLGSVIASFLVFYKWKKLSIHVPEGIGLLGHQVL